MDRRPPPRIFISYRTDDTGHAASRLCDDLAQMYGSERVFIDHKQIAGGEPWGERLTTEAAQAAIMFVLIGAGWLKAQNPTTGDRRLNEPDDWVRREIQTALDAGVTVVPILVDDARPLTPTDLRTVPEIAKLAERQSLRLRRNDWDSDVAKLGRLLLASGVAPEDEGAGANAERGLTGESSPRSEVLARLASPIVPRHFRGREKETQRVAYAFGRGRWCALVAIGGSGKTALAARIAADRPSSSGHNVVWIALAGTADVDVPQEWLANAFGSSVRTESSAQQRSARLRAITKGSSTLIVLDDPVSDAQLSELMASIGSGNDVLITTREQLPSMVRFGVEIVEVTPLPAPEATEVLLSIMGTSPEIPDDRREWEALAQAVGNHPLSLEVLAGDLLLQDQIRPALYLQDRIATGTWCEGEGTLARLRKSLIDSVGRSHAGYGVAFAALGAFEGSAFSTAAVAEVCAFDSPDEARGFLLDLRRRLCVRRQASGLYSLHPFVAETARQAQAAQAADFPAQSAPVRRHIAHYGALLQAHGGYEWNIERYPSLIPEERELVRAVDGAAALAERAQDESYALRGKCAEMSSLISWYLHWRGHWDLRIRLCERVCTWAEQELLPRMGLEMPGIVGNLYVDQGWIHLQRGSVDRAKRCASRGRDWLRNSGDLMFATELTGQVALKCHDYAGALKAFESLRRHSREGSRVWLVFSYRLADALWEAGDTARGLALLEDLLQRIEVPASGQQIDDVRGRILYRVAMRRHEAGRVGDAISLARRAAAAFASSGIIAPERRAAVTLVADLLRQSGAAEECRRFLIAENEQAERQGDFEMLAETRQQLAAQESGTVVVSKRPTDFADI